MAIETDTAPMLPAAETGGKTASKPGDLIGAQGKPLREYSSGTRNWAPSGWMIRGDGCASGTGAGLQNQLRGLKDAAERSYQATIEAS
jgi:hypothetical protein